MDKSPMEKKETKSVIDYIVIKKEDEQLVRDEAESIKIQGTTNPTTTHYASP